MARTIIIRIVVDNRDAINAAKAQAIAQKSLNETVAAGNVEMRKAEDQAIKLANAQKDTAKSQDSVATSFLKANLASRALAEGYNLIKSGIVSLSGSVVELDLNFAKVAAVTGANKYEMTALKDVVFQLGRTTAASTEDISGAALELAKLGFEGKNLEIALGGVARLSALLGDSLETTGNLVGGVIQTFDLSAEEAAKVADKLFVATGKSALNIEGFRVAFALAGNVAHDAGISFDELAAVIAALSNQGLRASTIGTGLRNFITELSKDGSKAQAALGGSIEGLGLVGSMQKLSELQLKPGSLVEIFGKPGSPVASGLGHAQEAYAKFINEIRNSDDALKKTNGLINDTLSGSIIGLKNSFVELFSVLTEGPGHVFVDVLHGVANEVHDIADGFKDINTFFSAIKNPDLLKNLGLGETKIEGGRVTGPNFDEIQRKLQMLKEAKLNDTGKSEDVRSNLLGPNADLPIVKATKLAKDNTKELQGNIAKIKESFQEYQDGGLDPFNFKTSEKELEKIRDHFKDVGKFKEANQAQSLLGQLQGFEDKDARAGYAKNKAAAQEDAAAKRDKKKSIEVDHGTDLSETEQYIRNMQDELDNFNQALEQTKIAFNEIDGALKTLSSEMVDSLFRWEWSWTHFGYVIKDIFKNLVKDFIAMEIRIIALKAAIKVGGYIASAYTGGASVGAADVAAGAVEVQGQEQFYNAAVRATDGIAATGFDGYVSGAKRFIAGEAGMERVTITPMNKPGFYSNSGNSGGGMTIIVQGDVFNPERLVDKVNKSNELSKSRYV